jgi:hypothetical protein
MSRRIGTFEEFQEHTLAIARGARRVDPGEPRLWLEARPKSLADYSISDLEEARQRIEETQEWVEEKSKQLPNPGWDHVRGRLKNDREAVEAEINRRLPP